MTDPQPLKLYNTLTRKEDPFRPLDPNLVRIYCCGPTVYAYQHIGNFKTFLFEDILIRTLRFAGYKVKHVMNITDVGHLVSDADDGEDKMLVAARREKKKSFEIAEYYTNKFFEDWDKLGLVRPDVVCKATDHIKEMIELIQRIEKQGFTYLSGGNVYFDVSKFPAYGKLALLDLEKLKAGARIEVDKNKRNAHDFVLWFTKSKFENQELIWDSPWGPGYPGWHIECSAMAIKHLGEVFDIHCGGVDHIPVHHTNEIAQSEAATGKPWVTIWMHSEFMNINAEKMSKSKGKLILVDDIIERGLDPLSFRYLCLGSHYRAQLNFTWEVLENANNSFRKLKAAVLELKGQCPDPLPPSHGDSKYSAEFSQAVRDDLGTPKALAVIWGCLSDKELPAAEKLALLFEFDQVLGLGMATWKEEQVELPAEALELLAKREEARKAKDWKAADLYRDQLQKLGFAIKDSAEGPKITRTS